MSSAVARPMRSSSKKLTSSTLPTLGFQGLQWLCGLWGSRRRTHERSEGVRRLYLFDRAGPAAAEVDAQLLRGAEDVLVGVAHLDGHAVAGEHLDVEAQRLHLLDEHLEGLRDAGLRDVLALDDGLVDLHAAEHVVGLDGEQLLQRVGRAVGLHRPDLHLTEALATELRLTTQRLLRDHRVRAGAAGVDLVVHEVQQLQDVDVADADRAGERLAGAAVEQLGLARALHHLVAVAVGQRGLEQADDLVLPSTVEDRRRGVGARRRLGRTDAREPVLPHALALGLPAGLRDPAEVGLEDLPDVHAARDAERVEDDVDRRPVLEERHVLDGQDLGDDALVAVPAGQLVAVADLALLGDVDPDQLVDARGQLVAVLAREHADADDLAGLAVRDLQRRVADLAGLLAEDRAQQPLLGGQLGLALRRDLPDQDVTGGDVGTDADDAALVEVGQDLLGDVRDVPGDLLGAELGVAGVDLVLIDVDRGEHVVLHEALRQDDRVLVVVALPRHERHEQVLAERHLGVVGAGAVGDDLADLDAVALVDDRLLVEARALVGAAELREAIRTTGAVVVHDGDVVGGELLHHTGLLGDDDVAGVDRGAVLHAGADERRLAAQQRDGLAHHVGPH